MVGDESRRNLSLSALPLIIGMKNVSLSPWTLKTRVSLCRLYLKSADVWGGCFLRWVLWECWFSWYCTSTTARY